MTSAKEIFVVQLSRASRKANRFIRRLPKEAREDVLAIAILWCWENKDNYSLVVPLDVWFVGAVRNAYRDWLRGERQNRAELVSEMRSNDDVEYNTMLAEALEILTREMDDIGQKIIHRLLEGQDASYIAKMLEISPQEVKRRIQRWQAIIPHSTHKGVMLRRAVTPAAINSDNAPDEMSDIDQELERLDMPPEHGKDCPPCWRCRWYDGYLPGARKDVRMAVVEPEVREAVANTESRKIEIAKWVRTQPFDK